MMRLVDALPWATLTYCIVDTSTYKTMIVIIVNMPQMIRCLPSCVAGVICVYV